MAAYDIVFTVTGTGDKTLTPKMTFSGGTGVTYAVSGGGASGSLTSTVEADFIAAAGQTVTYAVSDGCTVTTIDFTSDAISGDINQFPATLTSLNIYNTELSGNLSSLASMPLTYFRSSGIGIVGNISSITGKSFTYLSLYGSSLVEGNISALTTMGTTLSTLNLTNCSLLTYNSSGGMFKNMGASLSYITLTGCSGLTAAMVNNIAIDLLYAAVNNSCTGKTLTAATSVPGPTDTGYAAIGNLRYLYGWTCTITAPTLSNTTPVTSYADLLAIGSIPYANFVQTTDITASSGWTNPLNSTNVLQGSYNGQDYYISGLTFSNTAVEQVGLIGAGNCNVTRVRIIGCNFTGLKKVGGVCGTNGGQTSYCSVDATSIIVAAEQKAGGVVGDGGPYRCSSYAAVSINGAAGSTFQHAGGVVGNVSAGRTCSECFAGGSVSCNVATANYIGGVVGGTHATGLIVNCYSTAAVNGGSNCDNIGGIVGYGAGTTAYCYAAGAVSGTKGGVVISGGIALVGVGTTGCYYDSEVTGQSDDDGRGTPKTTAEMAKSTTYIDWDLWDTWYMAAAYPILRAFGKYPGFGRLRRDRLNGGRLREF